MNQTKVGQGHHLGWDDRTSSFKSVIKLCLFVLHECTCVSVWFAVSTGVLGKMQTYTQTHIYTHKQQEREGWIEGQTERAEKERVGKKASTWQDVLINEETN